MLRARGSGLELHIKDNSKSWKRILDALSMDDELRTKVHTDYGAYLEEFVPEGETGNLRYEWEATPEGVKYLMPYAHYIYKNKVFGPNYMLGSKKIYGTEYGNVVFRTPKGVKKTKTGEEFGWFTGEELLYPEWDKIAMADGGKAEFRESIAELFAIDIKRKLNG